MVFHRLCPWLWLIFFVMPVLILSVYILNNAFVFQHLRPAIPQEPKASPGSLSNFQKQLVADGLGGYGTKAESNSSCGTPSALPPAISGSRAPHPCICTCVQINRALCMKCPRCCHHPSARTRPSVLSSSLQPLAYILLGQKATNNKD